MKSPRLAVRGLVLYDNRLLMVNAWPGGQNGLLCAPGGGVEAHNALSENLIREMYEETGLTVSVGEVAMVSEFHDPDNDFHQVEIYFRCNHISGDPNGDWTDPEGVVTERYWLTRDELERRKYRPRSLPVVAWAIPGTPAHYAPLEHARR